MSDALTLRVTMHSDWHVGTGYGRTGEVDRLVSRDTDGLPYLPAKTLTGVWRDACELVALGLDDGTPGAWCDLLETVFGSQPALSQENSRPTAPRPASMGVRSAHMPVSVKDAVAGKPRLHAALTFVKPGVGIDEQTGAARANFLRFEEMARAGAVLDAVVDLPFADPHRTAATALLVAGAAFVEGVGGKRRRGAGRCTFDVIGAPSVEDAASWLEENASPPAGRPAGRSAPPPPADDRRWSGSAGEEWVRVPLRLRTVTPVVVAESLLGNVVTTDDRVPGRMLLPLLARLLTAAGVDPARVIADRALVVTDAVVTVGGRPARPVPTVLQHPKEHPDFLVNRLVEPETPEHSPLKGLRSGWIGDLPKDGLPERTVVPRRLSTHNTIHDETQRPTSEVGGVYSYQAIAPDVELVAEVRLPQTLADFLAQNRAEWWTALDGLERMGRSSKDDYGSVEVSASPPRDDAASPRGGTTLTLWLLSDVVLLDARLRPAPTVEALADAVTEALGVTATLRQEPELLSAELRTARRESWQTRWGLPRPSVVGIAAGSCVVLDLDSEPDPRRLMALERDGIGERRAEGFGQVRVNDPLLDEQLSKRSARAEDGSGDDDSTGHAASSSPPEWFRAVELAAWRDALRRSARLLASTSAGREVVLGVTDSKPTNAQLGGLRQALSTLGAPGGPDRAMRWVRRQTGKDRWPEKASDTLAKLVDDPQVVWGRLALPKAELTAGDPGPVKETLWAEAVQTLVAECLLARQRTRESNGDVAETNEERTA